MNITAAQISSTLAEFEEQQLQRKLELRRLTRQAASEGRLVKRRIAWFSWLKPASRASQAQQITLCPDTLAITNTRP